MRFPKKSDPFDSNSNGCLRQFTDGRCCRMLRKKGHPTLCIFHAREEQQLLESDKLAEEFASLSGKLNTVTDINHVLGKVFTALAENVFRTRRPPRLATSASFSSSPFPASKAKSMQPCNTLAPTTPCSATPSRFSSASARSNAEVHPPTRLERADPPRSVPKSFGMNRSRKEGGGGRRVFIDSPSPIEPRQGYALR